MIETYKVYTVSDFSLEEDNVISGLALPMNEYCKKVYETKDGEKIVHQKFTNEAFNDELITNNDVCLYLNHLYDRAYARSKNGQGTMQLSLTPRGLEFRAIVDDPQVLNGVKRGDYDKVSVGVRLKREDYKLYKEGEEIYKDISHIYELFDVSILSIAPAFSSTYVYSEKEQKEIEDLLLNEKADKQLEEQENEKAELEALKKKEELDKKYDSMLEDLKKYKD